MSPEHAVAATACPVALTIAGADNSGGAGIQADLKTFHTFAVYGTSAITCLVAQRPGQVSHLEQVSLTNLEAQIRLVFEAFPVQALKTGLLGSAEAIALLDRVLGECAPGVPWVLDPVMISTSGTRLLSVAGVEALRERLLSRAALVTPNRDEAEVLAGESILDLPDLRRVAQKLADHYGVPFLVKGGHLHGDQSIDVLAGVGNGAVQEFATSRIRGLHLHGTGCTLSAAITAGVAKGLPLVEAVGQGKDFISRAIDRRFRVRDQDLLNHFPENATL